MPGYLDLSWKK
nr:hypothetical protein [Tanacetum cinerariifolium]